MPETYEDKVRSMAPAKALALAAYGESVAAYRYRTLAEKAPLDAQRKLFTEMAEEEQGHHQVVRAFIDRHFPGSDYVLSPQDKELVTVGTRSIEVTDEASFAQAMRTIRASERLTGRFYFVRHEVATDPEAKAWLKEMADECFEHAARLEAPPLGG